MHGIRPLLYAPITLGALAGQAHQLLCSHHALGQCRHREWHGKWKIQPQRFRYASPGSRVRCSPNHTQHKIIQTSKGGLPLLVGPPCFYSSSPRICLQRSMVVLKVLRNPILLNPTTNVKSASGETACTGISGSLVVQSL